MSECPHGVPDGDQLRDDGRPSCPLCRVEARKKWRREQMRRRHPGHPYWDPQSAAANDVDWRDDD